MSITLKKVLLIPCLILSTLLIANKRDINNLNLRSEIAEGAIKELQYRTDIHAHYLDQIKYELLIRHYARILKSKDIAQEIKDAQKIFIHASLHEFFQRATTPQQLMNACLLAEEIREIEQAPSQQKNEHSMFQKQCKEFFARLINGKNNEGDKLNNK